MHGGFFLTKRRVMCRNIKNLYNFEPPASHDELHDAALQFIRKVSGMQTPSALNKTVFNGAVNDVTHILEQLMANLSTSAPTKNREEEAAKAKARNAKRFASR